NSFGISATIAFAFVMPNSRYLLCKYNRIYDNYNVFTKHYNYRKSSFCRSRKKYSIVSKSFESE
ncbi:hypothetical protein, partial [Leptospira noguchii]|uniref:hypothetical protein n=1 Tax=Leptospira noguchii TaxID=28182 RepID=UPI00114721DD